MTDNVAAALVQYGVILAASMALVEWRALPLRKPWGKRTTMLLYVTALGMAAWYVGLVTPPASVDTATKALVYSVLMAFLSVALSAGIVAANAKVKVLRGK